MPATKTAPGQHGLTDKKITDNAIRIQVRECVETMGENHEAAKDYARAAKKLKELIDPWVQPCEVGDRLEICDGEFLEIKIYSREEFTVEAYDKKRGVRLDAGDDGDD